MGQQLFFTSWFDVISGNFFVVIKRAIKYLLRIATGSKTMIYHQIVREEIVSLDQIYKSYARESVR